MRRQAVHAEALAHGAMHASGELAVWVPVGRGGQAFAQGGAGPWGLGQLGDAAQQGAHAGAERFGGCGDGRFEGVDALLLFDHRGGQLCPSGGQGVAVVRLCNPVLVAGAQVGDERLFVGLRVMDQATERIEPALLEPMEHHVQRRALLADEQHALAASGVVGNQVGDGLRLAGARWALDDEAALAAGQADSGVLCGIRCHHAPLLVCGQGSRRLRFHLAGLDREHAVERRVGLGVFQQLRVVAHQRHLLVVEVGQGHLGEIDIPGIAVPLGCLQHKAFAVGRVDGGLRHVRLARSGGGRGSGFKALRELARLHPVLVQRAPQRTVVVLCVAVGRQPAGVGRPLCGAGLAPPELLHALHRLLSDQADGGLLDQPQLDSGLGAPDLGQDVGMQLSQRGLAQVHRFGQPDVVQLAQVMAQHRVELRVAVLALDHVLVAHTFAFDQLDRQPQQRRQDALVRRLLQVVPAQEGDHQAQVAEAIFGTVAAGVRDQPVQRRGQVGLVIEAQPLLQRHRTAGGHVVRERTAPCADVLGPDALDLQHQRHAGHGEVDVGGRGPEIQQAVAPGQVEQAVAQVGEHRRAARRRSAGPGEGALHVQPQRLLAPGTQPRGQRGHIGGPVMPVDFRHLHDDRGHDGVQPVAQQEQVAAMGDEAAQVVFVRKVQPAGQARQRHAEQKEIADLVMVAELQLPARRPGQVDRPYDRRRQVQLQGQVPHFLEAVVGVGALQCADDVQAGGRVRLYPLYGTDVHRRGFAVGATQAQAAVLVDQNAVGIERGHLALCVQGRHLLEQRQ